MRWFVLAIVGALVSVPGSVDAAPTHLHFEAVERRQSLVQERGVAGTRSLRAQPLQGAITIDGRFSEPQWAEAEVARGFVQQVPNPGEPATMDTEARVLVSDDAVYVGVRLHDSAPDSIVGRLARRGESNESDWVYVALDSHLDRRSAFMFGVNAAGVKRDIRVSDDVRQDSSWEAVWDVAVSMDQDGWTAEFRIPLSQLRFSVDEGPQTWGLNVQRIVARTGEVSHWAHIEPGAGSFVSRFGLLTGIQMARGPRRLEVFPYVTTRLTRAPGDLANPYFRTNDTSVGSGADLRLGLSSWLTLDATINPDFGQVEQDPSVVNLSAFEVFLPERRPFFVSGAEYFQTPGTNLFYSRRIGRMPQLRAPGTALYSEQPDQTRILGAAKLTGRSPDGWSIGFLSAFTSEESLNYLTEEEEARATVEPRTNYSFARVGRDFRGGATAVNATATSTVRFLTDDPGMEGLRRRAFSGGLDARHRFHGNQYEVTGTLNISRIEGDPIAIARAQLAPGRYFQRPDADHLNFRSDRTALTGNSQLLRVSKVAGGNWRGGVQAGRESPGFEVNDLGLHFFSDQVWQSAWVARNQFTSGSLFRSWSVRMEQFGVWTGGGERRDVAGTLDVSGELQNRWRVGLWGMRHRGGMDSDHLRGGPGYLLPGNWMGRVTVSTDQRRMVSGNATFFATDYDDGEGHRRNLQAGIQWRPSTRAELRLTPSLNRFRTGSQFVTARPVGELGETRYVLAELRHTTAAVEARVNFTVTPDVSFELHARPFVSAGRYDAFNAVVLEHARTRDRSLRLDPYSPEQLQMVVAEDGSRWVEIDESQDEGVDIRFPHPDFNRKDLRATALVRWEFRPGSTMFLVWSHDRSRVDREGTFDWRRDSDRLWRTSGRSTVAVKASYRIGG